MEQLKLAALDEEDLKIISAHVQDALVKAGDLEYVPSRKFFIMPLNRFAWECSKSGFFREHKERRNCVLHFGCVLSARRTGIDPQKPGEVLELLAILFTPGEAPAGSIDLIFSGSAAIRLEVECIEARLCDLGAAWAAQSRPAHMI